MNISKIIACTIASATTGVTRGGASYTIHNDLPMLLSSPRYFQDDLTITDEIANTSSDHVVEVLEFGSESTEVKSTLSINYFDWSPDAEVRFEELASREALATITAIELQELDNLEKLRTRELIPRTYEEVKREYELDAITDSALAAIDKLIEYAAKYYRITA